MREIMSKAKLVKLGMTALKNNFVRLNAPYKLTFSITYRCQSRCLSCNIWQIKPTGELTLDEIREFAKKNTSFKWVEITGGEPFLRGDVADIVRAFKENCKDLYLLTMPTNSLCNHDMFVPKIEQILQMGIPRFTITISLDGYRELHDKIRGIPGNFDKAMETARRLRELQKNYKNLFFVFGYTMSKFNQGELEKTYQEVKKIFPDITYNNFHINLGQVSEIYYANTNLDVSAQRETLAREINSFISKRKAVFDPQDIVENAFLKKLAQYVATGEPPMKSRSLDASLFMDSYGDVYPSIMWSKKIGNIKENGYSLQNIWYGEVANEVRRLIKEGKEPKAWTACEAYQTIVGNIVSML